MTHILSSDLDHSFGETNMQGYFAIGAEGPTQRPGILIVHDAFGLDSFCFGAVDRLAAMGYAAMAIDLWVADASSSTPRMKRRPA